MTTRADGGAEGEPRSWVADDTALGGRPIGVVAVELGVSEETLRSWERRYGTVVPARTASGQRRYSPGDVARLRAVVSRIQRGQRPADAFADTARQPADAPAATDAEAGPAVLVVDRTEAAGEALAVLLRRHGYTVTVTTGAESAVELVLALQPRAVLVELLVDGGAGRALCRELRDLTGVAVVALSSLSPSAAVDGADLHLSRPIAGDRLVDAVAGLLEGRGRP